jgi:hypothetical protein
VFNLIIHFKIYFENAKMGINSVSLIYFQQIYFQIEALETGLDHRQILRLKQMAVRSEKAEENMK